MEGAERSPVCVSMRCTGRARYFRISRNWRLRTTISTARAAAVPDSKGLIISSHSGLSLPKEWREFFEKFRCRGTH
jgi:hypothetical protein